MRGVNRKKVGLWVVAFVLIVGALEVAALKLGSFDFRVHDPGRSHRTAVADPDGGK